MSSRAVEADKQVVAEAAVEFVEPGMTVGLGTGSTVAYLLPALARRQLDIRCVATSRGTETDGTALGLHILPFSGIDHLDVAIDGADQVDPRGWLVKGGGGAHTREKIVAAAAARFVVIVSADKTVDTLEPPVPLELLRFGLDATLRALPDARIRDGVPDSPDGGVIADWHGSGLSDPARVAGLLAGTAGVVEHGLFAPELVSDVLISRDGTVEHRRVNPPRGR
ncbi:MAG: ribose 5-phosphate isomerase A [Acidimicrobiaceae bacterium]|nr:ribose 5-phosphate isomerase A [Acidimicrobiaceae bacterium]